MWQKLSFDGAYDFVACGRARGRGAVVERLGPSFDHDIEVTSDTSATALGCVDGW